MFAPVGDSALLFVAHFFHLEGEVLQNGIAMFIYKNFLEREVWKDVLKYSFKR